MENRIVFRHIKSYIFVAFLLLSLFAWEAFIYAQNKQTEKKSAPAFKEALQHEFIIIEYPHDYDFNPHTSNYADEAQLFTGLYEGLFSYDPYSLEPLPALAESARVSRDKKTWTFKIRKDAVFSDGAKITAQTFYDSWVQMLAPETDAPFASLLDCVKGVADYRAGKAAADAIGLSVRDEYTLIVQLENPTEHLPRILCHHSFAAVPKKEGVYSGPFVLESATSDTIKLVKNPKYRDAANVPLPEITIKMSEDAADNAYLLNNGRADWAMSAIDTSKVLVPRNIKVSAEFATEYLFFKSDKFPWNQHEFRSALLTAVPWDELREQTFVPAETFIYALPGYDSPAGYTSQDTEEAKILLDEAKKQHGVKADEKLSLTFAIMDSEYMKEQAKLIKDAWTALGIDVQIQSTPPSRYLSSIESWNADLFSYTWIGDFADPVAFLELFRGDSTLNISSWANAEFDALLEKAAATQVSGERFSLLANAEGALLDSGMVIPISHPVSVNVIDLDAISGWFPNALDIHPFKYIYFTGATPKIQEKLNLVKLEL
ncbi:MAG: peptide ABC transporter substrate-binding protein [Treponemataceae bacterium]|nr:MAG: peptide ABC transporter substrate-binding protein [Treponemataceae bacterium]